jgi:serine/threonine protein kinase
MTAMSASSAPLTKEGLAEQARYVLQALAADTAAGNPSYLSAMRVRLGRATPAPIEEQIAFLEKFGYLLVNRTNNVMSLTRDGELVANGDKGGDLLGDVAHYFDARLKALGRSGAGRVKKPAGELLDDRYRRVGQVGSGGVGTVYRGLLLSTERPVAIKVIRDVFAYFTDVQRKEVVRRLDTVVRSAARLQHPNVAQVLDCNLGREHPYVVTQLAPSGNLRKILGVDEPLSPSRVIAYFVQMCHALRSAHNLGITHRALKPENVLLDLYGNVVVSDFGMSRIVERDAAVIHQVFVGMGSVAYLAPEQFADPRNADARSDIYALGILLYEMCTRRLPGRRSAMPSEVNRELPKGLDDVFDQMTQDAPEDRFGSIQEVLEALYAATGVEAHLDKRRAVLFAESPSFDLPMDSEYEIDDVAPDPSMPATPGVGPLTMESPPLQSSSEQVVITSAPRPGSERTDVRVDVPRPAELGLITEDRIVAPPVPFRTPGDEPVTPPPRAEPRGPTAVESRRPVVDDEFDDVGGEDAMAVGEVYDDEDLFDERMETRLPGSDPRKARVAGQVRRPLVSTPPGPAGGPPRKK